MKYYKLILGDKIIGAVNSDNFIKFSPATRSFLRSNELKGEYITWNGGFYRDTWMAAIQFQLDFTQVIADEIDEHMYEIYKKAFEVKTEIEYVRQEQEPIVEEEYIDPKDIESIEFIRKAKIDEMSLACRRIIENGFDLTLRMEPRHFSLDTQDQLNLISLSGMAQTQEMIPYHADGEMCIFYTADEINQIVAAATNFKVYHTTYYNALKNYINSLTTIEEISAIEYGVEIPDPYKSEVLRVIE